MTKSGPPRRAARARMRTRRGGADRRVPRYRFQRFLCSAGEWRFYRVLDDALGERFDVMFQVRVAAILRPRRRGQWESHGRRVSQKAFDFVLVEKGTSLVRCAVELDDRTHEQPERRRRDRFLEAACRRAGLPLFRMKVARDYDPEALRTAVLETMSEDRVPSNQRRTKPLSNRQPKET